MGCEISLRPQLREDYQASMMNEIMGHTALINQRHKEFMIKSNSDSGVNGIK